MICTQCKKETVYNWSEEWHPVSPGVSQVTTRSVCVECGLTIEEKILKCNPGDVARVPIAIGV